MTTAIPLVSHRARATAARLGLVVFVLATLVLLAFVALSLTGIAAPRLDGPELAPFRWGNFEWTA